ncbi:MAG: outer membrane beta-barrel protein [Xanthobacteraceae bacterium]|jgi:hypothetical protein
MKRLFLLGGLLLLAITVSNRAMAADVWGAWQNGLPTAWVEGPSCNPDYDYNCSRPTLSPKALKKYEQSGNCDPYVDFKCLDAYLGQDFATRLYRYYVLEWGHGAAPSDPNAPPSRRTAAHVPPSPQSSPPMPFTEWPYGGTTLLGVNRTASVDSPLMVALAPSALGHWMADTGIQVYGWVDPAGNLSTNKVKQAGNLPISYDYTPNTIQLDQAVLYIERTPDTVQSDHIDWGFRVSPIYGVDYRYTFAYGLFSKTLNEKNDVNGFDIPMAYGEIFVPQIAEGMMIRVGRFISLPDIEAQLAPNNYTYSHSLTYTWDNYTNTGVQLNIALDKNWIIQPGINVGTEAMPWHWGNHIPNPAPNPLYPGNTMLKDPGAMPSATMGVRWTSDDGRDDLNITADSWNDGTWGYNNLMWLGFTYYHIIDQYWHFAFETYNEHSSNVPNALNPTVIAAEAAGGLPFATGGPITTTPFNGPGAVVCDSPGRLTCAASSQAFVLYVNYSPNELNNFSLRGEFYMDPNGFRTGVATNYAETALSWQHWLSPQIELRPEIGYYRSLNAPAFNGNVAEGILPSRDWAVIAASDLIFHF